MKFSDPTRLMEQSLTVFPLPGGRVDEAKQLKGGDSLGVQVNPDRLALQVGVGLVEGA